MTTQTKQEFRENIENKYEKFEIKGMMFIAAFALIAYPFTHDINIMYSAITLILGLMAVYWYISIDSRVEAAEKTTEEMQKIVADNQ